MNLTRRVSAFVVLGLLALSAASTAAAQTYVENGVQGAGRQPVIITVTPGHENDVIDTLRKHGSRVKSQHPSINGVAADISGSDVADLAKHGAVTITRDHTVHLSAAARKAAPKASPKAQRLALDPNVQQLDPSISTLRLTLGLSAGSADNLGPGVVNGKGIRIAIIDSGIAPSADFQGRIVGWKDYTAKGAIAPYDDLGHGTHIAGLIASSGVLSNYMFQGVAPKAQIVVLKVLDSEGASRTSTVIAAIEDVVANRSADIINLSLGHPITAPAKWDPLVQAIESASRAGIVVLVAAGNGGPGYGSINSPGNAPSAITVGAANGKLSISRVDDDVPSFSSRGPTWYDGFAKPDVVAQGVNLYSNAAPNSALVNSTNPAYPQQTSGSANLLDLSGTSMAVAVATGVVALELDANANQATAPLTPNAVKAILEYTAVKVANTNVLTQGAGQVNAAGAVQLAGSINTAAKTGTWWLTGGVTGFSTIGGASYAWAQNIIWGTSLFGGRFIYYKNLAWDDNIIWGTGVVRGRTLVSGSTHIKVRGQFADNIIWGTDIQVLKRNLVFGADADNIIWGTAANLSQFRVVGERQGNHIVWNTDDGDNIIWGTLDDDNIIWGTDDGDNIIWGTWSGDGDNIIWGTTKDSAIVNGKSDADDNIIWGTSATLGTIVKKTNANAKGKALGDNIIWGTDDADNIIWGTAAGDNIIWGTSDDNIIWGTDDGDNIIWGTSVGGRN